MPNDRQHQQILASMIGDGCLIRATARSNYRMVWNMGSERHAAYKKESFSWIGSVMKEKENPGFGDRWFCVQTSCSPLLTNYAIEYGHSKVGYDVGKIARELRAEGWAWFFGDDGSYSKSAIIHTEGFSDDEVESIRIALIDFIGNDGVVVQSYIGGSKKREMKCLRMRDNARKEFFKRIENHMADGMEYKVRSN